MGRSAMNEEIVISTNNNNNNNNGLRRSIALMVSRLVSGI